MARSLRLRWWIRRFRAGPSAQGGFEVEPRGGNTTAAATLSDEDLRRTHAYWRAANFLSVGQIYLLENPLLKEPLQPDHIKPRLLGHWGTTPGLNFIYAHMNRAIKVRDHDAIYVMGPGHGGPGLVANTYLEGSYSGVYPHIAPNARGLGRP